MPARPEIMVAAFCASGGNQWWGQLTRGRYGPAGRWRGRGARVYVYVYYLGV